MPSALGELIAGYDAQAEAGGESGCTVLLLVGDDREPLYLKHGVGRFAVDVMDEAARLAWLAGRVPVPVIRQSVAHADAAWLLTTALPGRTADQCWKMMPTRLVKSWPGLRISSSH
jgi:aminoglycoside 3'-phosphotransferase I